MSERTQQHPAHAADELRARIQAFRLDEPGSVFPFSARLARENGWTRDHALRVIEEYRRFVYLAMTAGHTVTPSVAVDEAWHLHLTYTRSYWDELCGNVLGRPLHHDPTRGGGADGARFLDAYTRTLQSYHDAFGAAPPRDIWPSPAERFAPAARPARWAIPGPHAMLALLGLLVLVGCAAESGAIPFILLFVLFAAIVCAQPAGGKKRPTDRGGCGGGDCGDGGGDGCGGGCGGCGG